jgi:glycine betaine/proline transport system ATP-binding protein
MDEPFSALDPLIRDKLQDELLDLQKSLKKTIVFVSHDLDEALKLGNTIAILEGGRIVQAGTAEDILLRPADDYVAEFVKHMNPLNVLRGNSVMTPASSLPRQDGALLIKDGAIRIRVDAEERPVGADIGGRAARIATADGATGTIDTADGIDMIVAPVDLTLRAAIALKQQTDHPILLVDQLGRLAGLCGDEEIYRGLLRRQ